MVLAALMAVSEEVAAKVADVITGAVLAPGVCIV
jgi:hypothetical protein